MRTIIFSVTAVVGLLFNSALAAEKPLTKSACKVVVYQLNHIAAGKAAAQLERQLLKTIKPKPGGAGIVPRSSVIVIPDDKTNTLLVSVTPKRAWAIRFMVGQIDRNPRNESVSELFGCHWYETTDSLDLSSVIERWRKRKPIPTLTEEEIRILETLQEQVSLRFRRVSFRTVIHHIATKYDFNIVVENKGLRDVGLTMKTPATISVQRVPLASALSQLLGGLQLGYTIEDEVLKITSRRRLKDTYVLKAYPVADIVAAVKDGKAVIDFDSLAGRIQSGVVPGSWKADKGAISRIDSQLSLAIRQTSAAHKTIGKLLKKIRAERKAAYRLPGRAGK